MEFKIDEDIRSLNLELKEAAYNEMKAMYQEEGRIHPEIVIWKGQDIIVDGHHRYRIAEELGLECPYEEREFEDKTAAMIYALRVQGAGRRDNSELELAYSIGKQYLLMKRSEGRPKGKLGQNDQVYDDQVKSTAEIIANRLGIGEKTVRRHAEFAEAIDLIKAKAPGDLWKAILRGDLDIKRDDLTKLAKFMAKDDLFYLPPLTEEEIKAIRDQITSSELEHLNSGAPNVPPVLQNSVNMKMVASNAEDVYCPFCNDDDCHLTLIWSKCSHSIAEAIIQAKENLDNFSLEASQRVKAREDAEKEKQQKRLQSVATITSNLLEEAYGKAQWWDKTTIPDILKQIENLKVKKREDYR